MGWHYHATTENDLIADLTKGWQSDDDLTTTECVAHERVIENHGTGNSILWAVFEVREKDAEPKRFIECMLLGYTSGVFGERLWGYKGMSECCHPYFYSCPPRFLEMAPVASEEWRAKVRQFAGVTSPPERELAGDSPQ